MNKEITVFNIYVNGLPLIWDMCLCDQNSFKYIFFRLYECVHTISIATEIEWFYVFRKRLFPHQWTKEMKKKKMATWLWIQMASLSRSLSPLTSPKENKKFKEIG